MNSELYTAQEVADHINRSKARVNQLARTLKLGMWYGNQRLFTEDELDIFRDRLNMQGKPLFPQV